MCLKNNKITHLPKVIMKCSVAFIVFLSSLESSITPFCSFFLIFNVTILKCPLCLPIIICWLASIVWQSCKIFHNTMNAVLNILTKPSNGRPSGNLDKNGTT